MPEATLNQRGAATLVGAPVARGVRRAVLSALGRTMPEATLNQRWAATLVGEPVARGVRRAVLSALGVDDV